MYLLNVCEHVFGIWLLKVLCRPSLIRLGAPVGEHEKDMYLLVYVNMYFLMFVNMYLVFGG